MSTDLTDLLLLNKSQIKAASEVLLRAFHYDPMSVYFYADELEREKKLPYLYRLLLSYCVRYGEVYATSPALEGVAAWLSSDNHPMTTWGMIRSGMLIAMLKWDRAGYAKAKNLGAYIDTVHKRLVSFKHWYLQIIGVDPQFQGKGYGSKLLRPMFARLDEEGLSCYLETMEESNILLYEHFGFRVLEKSIIPPMLNDWVLLRDSQQTHKNSLFKR